MADYPLQSLDGKTPLDYAKTPNFDALAKHSRIGLVRTVPSGFTPGSDVANLGVLGYDVHTCYTGRSPLEALSIGVKLAEDDLAMRANLVTLSDGDFEEKVMLDYSADEIDTKDAQILIDYLNKHLSCDKYRLYTGTSYRHCFVLKGASPQETLTPPHDIRDKKIAPYLPKGALGDMLIDLIKRSYELLKDHPVNVARIKAGKRPANALWFWGEGTKPQVDDFKQKYGKSGCMISAVDLLKGIAIASGMKNINVVGATGTLNTNFGGKAQACIDALNEGADFCMVHVEATDECAHQGDAVGKVKAIESIDQKIVGKLLETYMGEQDFAILIMPDHYTPTTLHSHTSEPVPYMLYSSKWQNQEGGEYTENWANSHGVLIENPYDLTAEFLSL